MLSAVPIVGIFSYVATFIGLASINIYHSKSIAVEKVPMRWSMDGNPTWYADKQIGLWFPVLIFLMVGAALLYKARNSPPSSHVWDYGGLIGCCILIGSVHYWHIHKIIAWAQQQQ